VSPRRFDRQNKQRGGGGYGDGLKELALLRKVGPDLGQNGIVLSQLLSEDDLMRVGSCQEEASDVVLHASRKTCQR
jgi:hypothetical protein